MKKIFLLFIILSGIKISFAQDAIAITVDKPVTVNGLEVGYNIVTESEKEVGNKGEFSRFSIKYYVTNTSNETKLILYKNGFFSNDVSPNLVNFKCLNATGARFTSKESTLQAKPCTIPVSIEDSICGSNKTKTTKRLAQIGYWIKAGETISNKNIVIVPLNEKPNMTATVYSVAGAAATNESNHNNNGLPSLNLNGLLKIKNFSTNTYINNQPGTLVCTKTESGWWSAEWWLVPVSGTNYYLLKNQWKLNFISTDNNDMLSGNNESANSMWIVEPVGNTNTFSIKNVGNSTYLSVQSGRLISANIPGDQLNARWIFEQ